MSTDEFMTLWNNPDNERTVVITDRPPEGVCHADGTLIMYVSFPPGGIVAAEVNLYNYQPF